METLTPLRSLEPRLEKLEMETPSTTDQARKVTKVSFACSECRIRRIRCSPNKPCQQCTVNKRECIFDELSDKRRKLTAKYVQQELEYYRSFSEQIIRAIRKCDPADVEHIVKIIRQGATFDEIRIAATDHLLQDTRRNN